MPNFINNPNTNFIAIIAAEFICCIFSFSADFSNMGFEAIIIKWLPALIGLSTLIIYIVSRFFFKKYNWVISLLGIVIMIIITIKIHQGDFSGVSN